jgi:hypothetical protein
VWQFEVKRLGKVTHADISMAPLLIFVGRNNTGKSYVATVVWALSHISSLLSRDDSKERRPTWFEKFTRRSTAAEKAGHVEITSDMAADLMKYLNSELEQKGGEYLRDVFAYNGFDGTSIKLTAAPFAPFSAWISKTESVDSEKRSTLITMGLREQGEQRANPQIRLHTRIKDALKRAEDRLFTEIVFRVLVGPNERRQRFALYVPAARTGLMLAMRALVAQLFEADNLTPASFPRPLVDFLQRMSLNLRRIHF